MIEMIKESAVTSIGFFWKSMWAFIMGYFISSMIQAFVQKEKMVKYMGDASVKSVGLATVFGAASSSCSFAALAAGRSLFAKGAHFIPTLAFLFASTNLVIELGVLIYIFLGWQFVLAEIIGGLLLVLITWGLVSIFYPKKIVDDARSRLEESMQQEEFDWKEKIKTKEGWYQVGREFVMNWQMVWKEIVIGFTLAGIIATFIPDSVWGSVFLVNQEGVSVWKLFENVLIAPFAAAMTFIGSMGNIPLSTILASSGVAFGGIMAFIYSDLMVPPIVMVNKKYYGWKVALYIAGIFYVAIIVTAMLLHGAFSVLNILPQASINIMNESPFQIDYTFWFNIIFVIVAAVAVYLYRLFKKADIKVPMMKMEGDSLTKTVITWLCIGYLMFGAVASII